MNRAHFRDLTLLPSLLQVAEAASEAERESKDSVELFLTKFSAKAVLEMIGLDVVSFSRSDSTVIMFGADRLALA